MIHGVYANKESFNAVTFGPGLNVILADRTEDSTERDTRNGVGKTILLEIIHFCLGGRAVKRQGLQFDALRDWAFTLDISIGRNRVRVTRFVSRHNNIYIDGSTEGWTEQPGMDIFGKAYFKVEQWRLLLGKLFFDIPYPERFPKFNPSYRSMISYFVRRTPDAYNSPFRHVRQQGTFDSQLHVAYLLGMNWEYAAQWQALKERDEWIRAFEKAVTSEVRENNFGSVGELETRRIQLQQEVAEYGKALESFRVHPQYESIQQEADRLTLEIHRFTNENVTYRRLLTLYEQSIREESPLAGMSVERLYEEAGIVFSDTIKRTLLEARSFHQAIVENRRIFLEDEVKRIRGAIDENLRTINYLTNQRSELMTVLETHGALQEMNRLQEEHVSRLSEYERLQAHLQEMRDIQSTKLNIRAEKLRLAQVAERDHEERRPLWSEAVKIFNEHSQALYNSPGTLVIDVRDVGYKFQVDIDRSGSEGIEKMKIFWFDLVLLQLQRERDQGIDFLIHDTSMYDAVDTRLRALALELAHRTTESLNSQYICTMNSDMVPKDEFGSEFDFRRFVRLTLQDSSPEGSLLGFRFERE